MSRTDDSGLHEFVYGALGEITATHVELEPDGGIGTTVADTYFTYDSFGRLRTVRYPDNELVTYEYDRGGLLHRVTGDRGSGAFDYVSELRYDEFGQRTMITYGNGVTTRYNTNALTRRMDSLETDSPVAGALQRLNYTYQPDGNIAGIWTGSVASAAPNLAQVWQAFNYDELNQLTYAWGYHTRDGGASHSYSLSMSYDRIHNITNKLQTAWATPGPGGSWAPVTALTHDFNYKFDSSRPHAATKVGGRPIDYDDNGNQTLTMDPNTGAVRSMVWDDDDRLLQVVDPSSTVSFRYDASGTRTHKVSSSGVTVYVNQYYTVRNAAITTKHVFAGAQRVASVLNTGSSNKTSYLHTNHLGSTEFVTDGLGGVQEHYEQLPFGESWVEETGGATAPTPYRFTGKELDEETGLYYFGARHYDPATGLWLSADPAMRDYASGNSRSGGFGSPANLNAYGYGWNSPLRMTDPDGREVVLALKPDGRIFGFSEMLFSQIDSRPDVGGVGMVVRHEFPGLQIATLQTWSTEVIVSGRNYDLRNGEIVYSQARDTYVRMPLRIAGQSNGVRENERFSSTPDNPTEYVDARLQSLLPVDGLYNRATESSNQTEDFPDNMGASGNLEAFFEAAQLAETQGVQLADVVSMRTNFATRAVTPDGTVLATHYWRHTQNVRLSCGNCTTASSMTTTIVEYLGGVTGHGGRPEELLRNLEALQQENIRNFRQESAELQRFIRALRGR